MPITGGQPDYVVAFLAWRDLPREPSLDLTASLKLHYDAGSDEYEGHETGNHWRLGGRMSNPLPSGTVSLYLDLWHQNEMTEFQEWFDLEVGPKLPWDSKVQEFQHNGASDKQQIHVRA